MAESTLLKEEKPSNGTFPCRSEGVLSLDSKSAMFTDANGNCSPNMGSYEPPIQTAEDIKYQGHGGYGHWRGETTPGRWVRKLGYGEKFMTGAADFGLMSTVYTLWFESKVNIDVEHVHKTSQILAQKLPHLRLCVNRKDGTMWYREMENHAVDVQELAQKDVMFYFEDLLKKKFDIQNGPMWFVRFLKMTDVEDSLNPAVLDPNNKFRFICFFGFHHNFTDGTTNMKFCDVFLKTLNNIVLNKSVDMKVEAKLSEPIHDRFSDRMREENPIRNNLWLMYYVCKRFYKGIITYGHYVHNFTKHYTQQPSVEAATRIIPGELDEKTTEKFLKRCKKEGVTLNSAFTAVANLAIYRMILEKDSSMKKMDVYGIQTINLRRYWTEEQRKDSCGCHISTLDVRIPTDITDFQDVWSYARRINGMMKHELEVTKRGIRLMTLGEKLRIVLYTNTFLEWAGYPSANDNHFVITNMGDVSRTFSGEGEVVQCSKLLRSVSGHYMNHVCQHTLHTFRGKLYYSLDYYLQKMKRKDALIYSKHVMQTLQEFVDFPLIQEQQREYP